MFTVYRKELTAEQEMQQSFDAYNHTDSQRINALIQFVNDHEPSRCLGVVNGKLHVTCEYVNMNNGEEGIEHFYIKPTLKAVRNWLGY